MKHMQITMKQKLVRSIWLSRTSIWRRVSYSSLSKLAILFRRRRGNLVTLGRRSLGLPRIFKIRMSTIYIGIIFRWSNSKIKILLIRFWTTTRVISLFPSLEALELLDLVIRLGNRFKWSKASISKSKRRNECNESLWFLKTNLKK